MLNNIITHRVYTAVYAPSRRMYTLQYLYYNIISCTGLRICNWKITREKDVGIHIMFLLWCRYAFLTGLTNLLKSWQHNIIVSRVSISDVYARTYTYDILFFTLARTLRLKCIYRCLLLWTRHCTCVYTSKATFFFFF